MFIRTLLVTLLLVPVALAASLDDYAGSYVIQGQAGEVVLTLEKGADGELVGRLSGLGEAFELEAGPEPPGISGMLFADGSEIGFVALLEGDLLQMQMFDVGPDGEPSYASAQTLIFQRRAGAPATSKKAATNPGAGKRNVVINDVRLPDATVQQFEQLYAIRIEDAEYWYDRICGAWGIKGGPTAGFIMPGMDLGGPLKADASNGNTGVFVNGRQLHQQDVLALQSLGPVYPGRYFLDAYGNVGLEGGPPLLNLIQASRMVGGKGGNWHSNITGAGGAYDGSGSGYVMGKDAYGKTWSVSY